MSKFEDTNVLETIASRFRRLRGDETFDANDVQPYGTEVHSEPSS